MFCKKCGKELEEKWTVCPYCGDSVQNDAKEEVQEKKRFTVKGKNKGILLIILAVVILSVCCSKDDQGANQTNEEKQSYDKEGSQEENKEEKIQLSYDLYKDVENGLLYSNTDGKITDKNGKVITEYENLTVLENGAISDGESVLEGLFAGAGGKIVLDIPGDVEYDETESGLSKLRKLASESACAKTVLTIEQTYGSYTRMDDDRGYFDEVVLKAWFNENGMPLAEYPPDTLWKAYTPFGLEDFKFIDGENYTFDMLKRSSPREIDTYAMILTNISKSTDLNGNNYFQGTDYITHQTVIVHGNFNKLLNGDDLLVFAKYTGLASDDTPNFKGFYIEIINNRINE